MIIKSKHPTIITLKLLMNSTGNSNAPRNDGTTPIAIATLNNHLEIVQLLENHIRQF